MSIKVIINEAIYDYLAEHPGGLEGIKLRNLKIGSEWKILWYDQEEEGNIKLTLNDDDCHYIKINYKDCKSGIVVNWNYQFPPKSLEDGFISLITSFNRHTFFKHLDMESWMPFVTHYLYQFGIYRAPRGCTFQSEVTKKDAEDYMMENFDLFIKYNAWCQAQR